MKVGFFSPLPPAPTGVADYSAALLGALRESGEVDANGGGDINLYHLGNNALHLEIYRRALEEPGIVVLHDAVLQHFFLGNLGNEAYAPSLCITTGRGARNWPRGCGPAARDRGPTRCTSVIRCCAAWWSARAR